MRFATYHSAGTLRPALLDDGSLIDLGVAASLLTDAGLWDGARPSSVVEMIRSGPAGARLSRAALDHLELVDAARHRLDRVRLAAPIPRPPNIYCVASNYPRPDRRAASSALVYTKDPATVIGAGAAIHLHPEMTLEPDYEAELAVVIGSSVTDVDPDHAYDAIFGYTCFNDVTARDVVRRPQKWLTAKDLETFSPMGPAVVHKSLVAWPPRGEITSRVNGEVRQHGDVGDLVIDIASLVSDLSRRHRLEPGDIIATGTPAGVGADLSPPRFLHAGDLVEVEIAGIGLLANPCV